MSAAGAFPVGFALLKACWYSGDAINFSAASADLHLLQAGLLCYFCADRIPD
jgi:hypothetical protein